MFDDILKLINQFLNGELDVDDDVLNVSYEFNTGMKQPIISVNGKSISGKDLTSQKLIQNGIRKPLVDQLVENNIHHIYMELPGVKKEDIELFLTDTHIELEAQHSFDPEIKYKAKINLDPKMDTSKIKSKLVNGILDLKIPILEDKKEKITVE